MTKAEEEIKKLTPADIKDAWTAGKISQKAFNILCKKQSSLTKEEKVLAVGYLAQVAQFIRRRDRKYEHLSGADRKLKHEANSRNVNEIPPIADEMRRRHTERSALFFIRHYCTRLKRGGFLKTPVPASMRKIIHAMQKAIETGVPYHIRMPRGHGKSSYEKGVTMWAMATGKSRLIETVAANGRKACGIVRDVWNCMMQSTRFKEDYPEIGVFLECMRLNAVKADSITYRGARVGMSKRADSFTLPSVEIDGVLPKSAGCSMFAVGFSSNVRGEVVGDQRPDLMIFDDLQDREIASNPELVQEKYDLVNGDFLGGDSHTDISSAFMTSTPIKPDDLSEKFAVDPYWRTETFKMLGSFPSCFDPVATEGLWQEFWRLWTHEQKVMRRDPHPACNAFYLEHRAEMDAGAVVLNPGNFRKNEISAIEHAMILYFRNPKTFAAEYQMEPQRDEEIYSINEQLILSRVREGSIAGEIPEGCVMVCAATDINPSYALSTVVKAYDSDCTRHIIDYWLTPCSIDGNASDTEFIKAVYDHITRVGREIKERGIVSAAKAARCDFHWGLDGSGNQFKPVTTFAFNSEDAIGFKAVALLGRTDREFNPRIGTRKHKTVPGRNDTVLCWDKNTKHEHIFFNKDKFEEGAQRSWIAEMGAPGGATLFAARRGVGLVAHDELILQICAEHLKAKSCARGDKFAYEWREEGKHDLGDASYMCDALAAFHGLTAGAAYEREDDDGGDDVVFL